MAALKLARPNPTREGFAGALLVAMLDINGLPAVYDKTNRHGLAFVDPAVVTRDSKFRH